MFRQEDYLVFDKGTNEQLNLVSVHMHSDEDTDVVVCMHNKICTTRKLSELYIFEKMFELCGDVIGNTFNTYTWDVVKNNRNGKMYTVLTKNVVIELDDTFETKRYLSDSEIDMFEDTPTEDVFVRLGNMYEESFAKLVSETRKQKKMDGFIDNLTVGSVIHTKYKGLFGNDKEYRLMLVSKDVDIDEVEFCLINLEHGNIVPTFVSKDKTMAIDFVTNVLKHEIISVEKFE